MKCFFCNICTFFFDEMVVGLGGGVELRTTQNSLFDSLCPFPDLK
jgi:hypothetical protein